MKPQAAGDDAEPAWDDPELSQAATKLQAAQRGKVARKEVAARKDSLKEQVAEAAAVAQPAGQEQAQNVPIPTPFCG